MKKDRRPNMLWKKFQRDRSGNFIIPFALASAVLFLSAGLAVEYSQALNQRMRITNALDAATLATARALQIKEISEDEAAEYLEDIFIANIGIADLAGTPYSLSDIDVDLDAQTITATAGYDQKLKLISVVTGSDSLKVNATTQPKFGISTVEVAMVLDVTNSMRGSKIQALREAATLAVEELLSINTVDETKIRVSLVPYSVAVNVGDLSKYVFADFSEAKTDAPAWDQDLFDSTGIGYDVGAFQATGDMDDMLADSDGKPVDTCATARKKPESSGATDYQLTGANPSMGMIPRDSRLDTSYCPTAVMLPLSANETALYNTINSLEDESYTGGHIGLQWAYYTISPDWANFMPVGSKPGDHKDPDELIDKYIILMTDGEFNVAFADSNRGGFAGNYYAPLSTSFAEGMCEEIKDNDIDIFTIGFKLTNNRAINMLKNCASEDRGHFVFHHEPKTGSELKATYEQIAKTITSLRLTN